MFLGDWDLDQTSLVVGLLKSYVGLSMAVVFIGAAMIIQVTVSFLGVLLCANCCSGERAMGLCAFVFTLIRK